MAAVRYLVVGWVALGLLAVGSSMAKADAYSWRWTAWTPGQDGVVANLNGPDPFLLPPINPASSPNPTFAPPPSNPSPANGDPSVADPGGLSRWAPTSPVASYTPPASPGNGNSSAMADGFINLGDGPNYPGASRLTTGGAQPWYTSSAVSHVFGGVPNAQQRADFTNTVLQRVEQVYQNSGVPVDLTTDPNRTAAHTISVVANTGYGANPAAAGITNQGGNGLSFIDKFGSAQSVDQLEWIVAHNVAHELMHAFGGEHHDTTGTYLDSAVTPWQTMVDPNTKFSSAEVQDLLSKNFHDTSAHLYDADGQVLANVPTPTPEPATWLTWTLVGSALAAGARARSRKAA